MQVMFLLSVFDTSIMDKAEKKACVWDWNLIPVKEKGIKHKLNSPEYMDELIGFHLSVEK